MGNDDFVLDEVVILLLYPSGKRISLMPVKSRRLLLACIIISKNKYILYIQTINHLTANLPVTR
jgi:hypothetical protein